MGAMGVAVSFQGDSKARRGAGKRTLKKGNLLTGRGITSE